MTVNRAVITIFACVLLGTFVGLGVGYSLGTFAPDFIRALFPRMDADANLAQVGIGLGTVNGGLIGVGVGIFTVGIVSWLGEKTKSPG